VGNPYSHATGKRQEKMVQNPKRTGFVEERFASRNKGDFGSVNPNSILLQGFKV